MRFCCLLLLILTFFSATPVFAQDVNLYLTDHFLPGKSIIKLNRDFDDPYMWVLAKNNEVYRINTVTKQLDNYTPKFQIFNSYEIFDIAGFGPDWVTLVIKNADSTELVNYSSGNISYPIRNNMYNIQGKITSIGASSIYTEIAYGFVDHPALLIATDKRFWRRGIDYGVVDYNGSIGSQVYSATYRDQLFVVDNEADTSAVNLLPVFGTASGAWDGYAGLIREGPPFGDTINTAYFTINEIFTSPPILHWMFLGKC